MKKLLLSGSIALLLLSLLLGTSFANPVLVSAHSTNMDSPPAANPYCQFYLQNLARHLNISVAELEQQKLAAEEDVLAQLVRDGKLTQAQADKMQARLAANAAGRRCD